MKGLTTLDYSFIQYCIDELEITTRPNIKIGDDHAKAQEHRAMGYYSPGYNYIWVLRGDRVPADWYRTLAHELVHWRQRELGQEMDGSDGSDLENEANSKAAVILRAWGRDNPEIYVVDPGDSSERAQYYLDHYRNLSPSDFKVDLAGDQVRITIPRQLDL